MKATNHPSDKMIIKNNNGDLLLEIDAEGVQSIKFKDGNEITGEDISSAIGKADTLPTVTSADAGRALVVDGEGKIVAGEASGGGSTGYTVTWTTPTLTPANYTEVETDTYAYVYVDAPSREYTKFINFTFETGDNNPITVPMVGGYNEERGGYYYTMYDTSEPVLISENVYLDAISITYSGGMKVTIFVENDGGTPPEMINAGVGVARVEVTPEFCLAVLKVEDIFK